MSWRREYSGTRPGWHGDSTSLNFPSQSRSFGRPLSYLAAQGAAPFHEEHHEDAYPMAEPIDSSRVSNINFPSSYRKDGLGLMDDALAHSMDAESLHQNRAQHLQPARPASVAAERTPERWPSDSHSSLQFNSPHSRPLSTSIPSSLRDRSPSSSSALLDLLNRYPSARQNKHPAPQRLYWTEERPTSTLHFRPSVDERGFPIVELTVPRSTHRTTSLPHNNEFGDAVNQFNQLSNSFHEFSEKPHWREEARFTPINPQYSKTFPGKSLYSSIREDFDEPEQRSFPREAFPVTYQETVTTERSNGGGPTFRETRTTTDFGAGPKTFVERSAINPQINQLNGYRDPYNREPYRPLQFVVQDSRPTPTNFSLDAFVDEVLGEDMNRSTNQWRSSFAQMQEKFKNNEEASPSQHPYVNGSSRQSAILTKSSSHGDMRNDAVPPSVDRKAAEAPEFRKSPQITSYWENTLRSTTPIPLIPKQLSAAERLQLLQEDPNDPPRIPQRKVSGEILAQKRAQFQKEAERVASPTPYKSTIIQPIRIQTNGGSNFDHSDHRLIPQAAGVARFPLEEFALSPPQQNRPKIHSPSPDQLSESSSVYQMPSGLPHPKPKHNIKEQIYYAGLQQNTLPRSGLKVNPNFPSPSQGSVTSRISEFEGRPGTPTLQLGGADLNQPPSEPHSPGPLSPRTTVFRNHAPVIQMEMGNSGRSTPIPSMFDFSREEIRFEPVPQKTRQSVPAPQPIQTTSTNSPAGNVPSRLQFNHAGQKSVSPNAPAISTQQKTNVQAINKPRNEPSFTNQPPINGKPPIDSMSSSIYEPADSKVLTPRGLRRQPLAPVRAPVPKFYFPQGKPVSQHENDVAMRKALDVFRRLPGQKASVNEFEEVIKAAGIPLYWKRAIYDSITNKKNVDITQTEFCVWWRNMTSVANDEAARFVYALSGGKRDYLEREDFQSLCYDIIFTHPGLTFYHSATEFHPSYVDVVITRIFWNVNRSWSGRITAQELRRSDFLAQLHFLEKEDDINKETRYFSYEHFYVIYCKFWELDDDHDMLISKRDMLAHDEGALTPLVVNRIFSKAVVRGSRTEHIVEFIGLAEFAAFLMADEDKKNLTSVEYWFRICDLDGDGLVTLYEMEEMYGQVRDKLTSNKIDTMQFGDVACNLLDMIRPKNPNGFALSDLKKCPLAYRFFNSFTNWRKFFNQEINEGEKPVVRNDEGRELSEWERYCAEEYESLMEAEGDEQIDETHVNLDDEDMRNSFKDLL
ncbi:unnamed protein product, partial [Mesorhabditis belari]|uniref:EF-hand domain-containing protein n=1 Tax=Mesorhabditis belari TaxID=2138241 RepID=A0AAF3EIN9_9BILA